MGRNRRHFPADQKAAAMKRHHIEKVPVSEVCEGLKLQPSLFYLWQRQLFENADRAFADQGVSRSNSREKQLEAEVAALKAKLARKDSVIAEISEEYTTLKKELGEP